MYYKSQVQGGWGVHQTNEDAETDYWVATCVTEKVAELLVSSLNSLGTLPPALDAEHVEIVRGVFITPHEAVYIEDVQGEVICWGLDDATADGPSFTSVVMMAILAAKRGPEAVREMLDGDGPSPLDALIRETSQEIRQNPGMHHDPRRN